MLNFNEFKKDESNSIQEMFNSVVFNLITDIPDSLLCPNRDPDTRAAHLHSGHSSSLAHPGTACFRYRLHIRQIRDALP